MKARAPGKIVLTGAYAVLHDAPALVVAVDRHAVADAAQTDRAPSAELRAAFGSAPAPSVDTRALFEGGHKLGLGSSAAVTVAALATRIDPEQRRTLFHAARNAHAAAQGGGSGVDVAASTYGGVLQYRQHDDEPMPRVWPVGLELDVFFSGSSARTASLLALVAALATSNPSLHATVLGELCDASVQAARVFDVPAELVAAAQRYARALAALGAAAGAPIVTPAFAALGLVAELEGAAFFGAGAGGGDVAVRLGVEPASSAFVAHAGTLGLVRLTLRVESGGATREPFASTRAPLHS